MQRHEYFDKLCSLAIIGELSAEECEELTSHVRNCRECQTTLFELNQISSEQLPLATAQRGGNAKLDLAKVREETIQRLIREGLRISPEGMRGSRSFGQRVSAGVGEIRWLLLARKAQVGFVVAAVAVGCVLGVLIRRDRDEQRQIQSLRAAAQQRNPIAASREIPSTVTVPIPANTSDLKAELDRNLSDANLKIARLQAERTETKQAMTKLQGEVERMSNESARLQETAGAREAEITNLRSQIDQLRNKLNASDAELADAHYQVTSLTAELKNNQSAIDREKELLAAGRDVRDLMGARNLHIIDVHDTDARGEARPFGRIFLTEGKRLIFYAYDLDSDKMKNAAFQAWGQRTDANRTAVNLGILYMDDKKQSRWALKVEDASLLKTIDSLFVTVEPQGGAAKPTGKKLMYAYLRNPINHP